HRNQVILAITTRPPDGFHLTASQAPMRSAGVGERIPLLKGRRTRAAGPANWPAVFRVERHLARSAVTWSISGLRARHVPGVREPHTLHKGEWREPVRSGAALALDLLNDDPTRLRRRQSGNGG